MSKLTMYVLEQNVIEQIKAEIDFSDRYSDDRVHEIVDSNIPIYYGQLAAMLADDTSLAYVDDEGLLGDNIDVFKIIQTAIYERLSAVGYDAFAEFQEAFENKELENV